MKNFKKLVSINFNRWKNALQSKDPKKISKLYLRDAIFIPTFSQKLKIGQSEAEEYFQEFLKKNPKVRIIKRITKTIDKKHYLEAGIYEFNVGTKNDQSVVRCRFTFIWRYEQKEGWQILHHHSSLIPQ
ncbi:MAG: nuclear transport factor 2 family protein [Endomicrobiia bacterium]